MKNRNGHTPEPWENSGTVVYLGNDGEFDLANCPSPEANARRIVACVNACAGSSTEWLEFVTSKDYEDGFGSLIPFETRHAKILERGITLILERNKAEQQRDKLLEALNEAADLLVDAGIPATKFLSLIAEVEASK
jgi:hypothetical protein